MIQNSHVVRADICDIGRCDVLLEHCLGSDRRCAGRYNLGSQTETNRYLTDGRIEVFEQKNRSG